MNIERHSEDSIHNYLVWDKNYSKVISRAIVLEKERAVELKTIDVDRMYRGSGVGTKLLKRIIADFSDRKIMALVFVDRVDWYVRNGFKVEGIENNLTKICWCS